MFWYQNYWIVVKGWLGNLLEIILVCVDEK